MAEAAAESSRLSREVGAVVAGRVFVSLLDSFKAFILLRIIDKAGYGTMAFALAWYGTAVGFGTLAIPDSLIALLPKATLGAQRSLVRQSLLLLAAIGSVLGLAIALMAMLPGMLPPQQPGLASVLPWTALAVAADLPSQCLQAFLLGIKRHRQASLRAISLSGMANLALVVPALLGLSVSGILACYAMACVIRLMVTLATYRSCFADAPQEPYPGGLRAQLNVAVPLSLNGMVGLGNRQLSTWVAGLLLMPAVFADFATGAQELPVVTMLPNAVAVAMLPHLSALAVDPAGRRQAVLQWHASMVRVALVMVPLWLVATVEAEGLMAMLGGEAYRSAALPFRVTALLLPLRLTGYGSMLLALGLPRAVLRSQLWALAANVLICAGTFVAHRHLGAGDQWVLAGASFSFVLAQAVAISVMLGDIGAAAGLSWWRAFPWSGVLRVTRLALVPAALLAAWHLVGAELAGVAELLRDLGHLGVPQIALDLGGLALRLLFFVLLFVGLALRAGLLPPDDRATVLSWLKLEPLRRKT